MQSSMATDLDESYVLGNERMVVAAASSPGSCPYMQDAFMVFLDAGISDLALDMFGICDGHGSDGDQVAKFVCSNIRDIFCNLCSNKSGQDFIDSLRQSFHVTDQKLYEAFKDEDVKILGGSTCNVVLIGYQNLYCCNIGDSRGILSLRGKAYPLSVDHKAILDGEHARILQAGGVIIDGRINGGINVSRSFGDFRYKKNNRRKAWEQMIISDPDICQVELSQDIDFIVVASDGVWDVMSNQEVVDFILNNMSNGVALDDICEGVLHNCLNNPMFPVSDNLSIVLAKLL